ncbi:MAG: TadE/TadG family type IV pilus assembly protein [Propionicimonas sp.]
MNERGLSESTQWAIVMPALLALVLGLVQTGIWLHGRSVASQAAAAAADVRAVGRQFQAEAEAVAAEIAHSGGLTEVTVSTSERHGRVQVTVSGQTQVFFDVGQSRIVEHAVLVEERVTSP